MMPSTLGGVPLPGLYSQEVEHEWVGKTIRRWTLRTRPMPYDAYEAIVNMIRLNGGLARVERAVDGTSHSYGGGAVLMELEEGDGEETIAYVYITDYRVHRDVNTPTRRSLELVLEEV